MNLTLDRMHLIQSTKHPIPHLYFLKPLKGNDALKLWIVLVDNLCTDGTVLVQLCFNGVFGSEIEVGDPNFLWNNILYTPQTEFRRYF